MSRRLDHIAVSTSPYRVRLLDNSCDQWSESPQWTLRSFNVGPGYTASLVSEGQEWRLAAYWFSGNHGYAPSTTSA